MENLALYEDEDLLILNKPAGIPSAPIKEAESGTALDLALARAPEVSKVRGRSPLEGGLLHRLDTLTSGVLAFAKNQNAFEFFCAQWKTGQVEKIYRAICTSKDQAISLRDLPLVIDTPIGHSAKSSKKMMALNTPIKFERIRGKPLEGETLILEAEAIEDGDVPAGSFDLTVQIRTGVMHQIRCHLSSIGYPIIGDPIYGPKDLPAERMFLHAWKLGLTLPSGPKLVVTSALPEQWPKTEKAR